MILESTSTVASGLDMKASIKASIHNLLLLSMLANQLALTSMLFSRSHNLLLERGIFDYVCALGLSNITFTQPQVSPTYFKLDFPFDPGVSRNCVQGIGPALEKDLVCASEFLGSTDLIRGDYGLLFVITIGEETLGFVIGLIITIGEETLGFVIGLIETPQLQIGSTFSTSINLVMFDNKEEHELFAIFLFWFCYPKDYAYHTALLGSPIKLLEISCYVTIVDFPFDPGEFDHPSISFDTSFQGIDTKFGRQFALNELFLVLFSCHLRQQDDLPQLIFHQLVGLYLIGRKSQLIGYGHYIARSRVGDPIFCRAVILKDCIQTGLEVVNGKPILFFDEIHLVLGAGWTSMSIEVSIYFKSLIAKRKIDAPEVFDEMLDSYNAFISPDISSIRRKTTTEFSLFKDTYLYEFLLETEIFQGMFFTVRANNVETVRSLSGNVAFLLTSDYSDGKVYNERKSSCFEFKYAGGSSFVSASSVVEHVISTELTCVVGSVLFFWNQIPFAYASIIWNKELNKQLRTTLHSHPDILVEVEKHGFPFAKSLTVSRLLQEWVYSNGDSASLVAFLLALCNEAASFRQESTLFCTQRLFALKSLQLVLLAYCSVVIDGVMGATRSQKQTKKKLYAGHFVHLLTFEWLPPWSLDVFLARFEVSMTTADPLKPSLMGFLILNLEDKVLIEDGGNVMNENSPIDDTGRELVTFMWDPG